MTTTLTVTSGQTSFTAQGYTVLPSPGTAVPDSVAPAIISAAYVAGVVLSSSAGTGVVNVPSRRFTRSGTGAPLSGEGRWLLGDEIVDSTGAQFECTVPGDPGTWVQTGSGTSGAPDWVAATAYKSGQLVAYGNTIWRAKADFTSGGTFNPAKWDLLSGGNTVLRGSLADGLPVVANRLGFGGGNPGLLNTPTMSRVRHTIGWAASGIRFLVGSPLPNESDPLHPFIVKMSVEYPAGTFFPVTFRGRATVTLDPGGVALSDPVAIDVTAGSFLYSRSYVTHPFGPYGALAASTSISATSLSLVTAPAATFLPTPQNPQLVTVDSGGNAEQITVTGVSGTTLTCLAATKAHASGVNIGQQPFWTHGIYSDYSEGSSAPGTDQTASGTVAVPGNNATTLTAAATAGDVIIKVAAALPGATYTVDTVGSGVQETVTVRAVTGAANPFTAHLAAPLANSHASGQAVTATIGSGSGFGPLAVVAERTSAPVTVVGTGDSIMNGTGYNMRGGASGSGFFNWFNLAFDGQRPNVNLSKAGEQLQTFINQANSRRRRIMFDIAAPGGWMFDEYGINDIGLGARTLVQIQADKATLWASARARGLKVAVSTLPPANVTSTDNYTTLANQTISTSGAPTFESVRLAYNAWLRGGTSGADLVVDLAAAVESTTTPGKWKVDANGPYTVDGLHPSKPGHEAMAAAVPVASFV